MPIVIKNPNSSLNEFMMLELQGDLENRCEEIKDCSGNFVGDVLFTKFGAPILIIGHHILFGKEVNLEKPFAVMEKVEKLQQGDPDDSIIGDSQPNTSISILDSTVNIENRTKTQVEYHIRGLIKKKLVFNQRPRPIISNAGKAN